MVEIDRHGYLREGDSLSGILANADRNYGMGQKIGVVRTGMRLRRRQLQFLLATTTAEGANVNDVGFLFSIGDNNTFM